MGRTRTSVCPQPGCPELTAGGPCPTHQAQGQRDATRSRRASNPLLHRYDDATWKRTRSRYRATHPTCARCPNPTAHVDHVIPRRILIAAGILDPDADQWLQPLCAPCHNRKTAITDTPLLRRLDAGADPAELAQEALDGVG